MKKRMVVKAYKAICVVGICSALLNPMLRGQSPAAVVDRTFGEFSNAVSLSASAGGQLFVLDEGKNELLEFSSKGELLKTIGGHGWGDLEFDSPTDVSVNFALDIYVADYYNRRVQRFDRKMNYVQTINADNIVPALSGTFYPRATALSSQGELFVVESDGRRVLKFNPSQELEREFGGFNAGAGTLDNPRDIAVTPEDKVIILDEHRIVEFDTYANYVSSFRLDSLAIPLSISACPKGLLVVDANKVILYSLDGSKQLEITPQCIVGTGPLDDFRDAFASGSSLYLLTAHSLVILKITPQ